MAHLGFILAAYIATFVGSAALAAYYQQIPVAHVEAGLRTGNLYSPWPEEANRKLTGAITELHFAPTQGAQQNLLREGIPAERIQITGNTVIDALLEVVKKLEQPELQTQFDQQFSFLDPSKKLILVTGHRRESFGGGFERICHALANTAAKHPDVQILYPVHLNPNVREPVNRLLRDQPNIHLIEPQDYLPFVYLMNRAHIILTDSGGIQEEAPLPRQAGTGHARHHRTPGSRRRRHRQTGRHRYRCNLPAARPTTARRPGL